MQGPDWQIGRIYGIPIRIHVSWLIIFWFVTWSLATGYLPDTLPGLSTARYWAMGAMAALLLFVSVLLHELGQTDESRPLTHRYRAVMQQPVDLSDGGRVADLRGELMLAVGELMDLVHREFLNPEPPAHEFPAGRSTKV